MLSYSGGTGPTKPDQNVNESNHNGLYILLAHPQ